MTAEKEDQERQQELEDAKTMAFGKGILLGMAIVVLIMLGISVFLGWPW